MFCHGINLEWLQSIIEGVIFVFVCISDMNSLRRNVNMGITSRRDPLSNVIRKISGSRRDVISRQGVITLFSESCRDVIMIFTFLRRLLMIPRNS